MEKLIDEWQWRQIKLCGNTEPLTPSDAHYIYGEEGGMQWFVDLDRVNSQWIVTVTDGISPMIRRIECTHEPTCGIDVADADRINGAIDEMKTELASIVGGNHLMNKKIMKKAEGVQEGFIYAPYIPVTDCTYINGIRVWDHRWWVNVFCKINWFFHFRMRKRFNKYKNTKIDEKHYGTINLK